LEKWTREAQKYRKFNTYAIGSSGSEFRFYISFNDAWHDVKFNGNAFVGGEKTLDLMDAGGYDTLMRALAYIKARAP
jgi:hypothetical protein